MGSFEIFVNYIFPAIILAFGLAGNLLGLKTMQRPKMLEIGPRNIYKYLFIMDTIYLVQIIVTYLQLIFNIEITGLSKIMCKIGSYLNYSLDSQSSLLLVYISIDRYVSIKMPALRFFMRKRNNQLIYFIFIFMFNLMYYLPVAYNYSLIAINDTLVCSFNNNQYSKDLISYMDLTNRNILPSILIILFSTLLGIEVIKSRKRILANFQKEENEYFYNNISLAITSILLNIINLLVQLPVSVYLFLPNYSQIIGFNFFFFLFYLSYSINFYILFMFNYLFRKEFFLHLKKMFIISKQISHSESTFDRNL